MSQNPLCNPEPWSLVAAGYQGETVPAFRQYCQKAIELSGYKPASRVLDVACGPGTLSLLLADSAASIAAIDFPDRLAGFREMYRTLKPGGRAAVSSWAPVSDSPVMQLMFGSLRAAFPE